MKRSVQILLASSALALNGSLLVQAQDDADDNPNDLNLALNYVLGQMQAADFFSQAWLQYFGGTPVEVPLCQGSYTLPLTAEADASLLNVLQAQTLRVGVSVIAASVPNIYTVSENNTTSTNLETGTLTGYEIACAHEATRWLGESYGVTNMAVDFVIIQGDTFFEPLVAALNNDEIDVMFSGAVKSDEREAAVDFTCAPNFATDIVIAAGNGVGAMPPSESSGENVPVACLAILCTFDLPAPFVLQEINGTLVDLNNVLINATDGLDYVLGTTEQLQYFMDNNCDNCSLVDIDPIASTVRAPATKQGRTTDGMASDVPSASPVANNAPTDEPSSSSSAATVAVPTSLTLAVSLAAAWLCLVAVY